MTNTLYKWLTDGVETYGHKLAVDGSRWVMKNSATAELEVMNKEAVIEVLPYTVGVRCAGKSHSATYQHFATAGELAVGDVVMALDGLNGWTLMAVHEVDTQSRAAKTPLVGYVLAGAKALTAPE